MAEYLEATCDNVLVDPIEEKTGSILLPEDSKKKPTRGVVKSVGPGIYQNGVLVPISKLKEGDEVIFRQWAGTSCEFKGGSYIHLKQSDVLAVVKKKS